MTKYKSNDPGRCPKCNSLDLDYDSADFEGDSVKYPWTCEKCGTQGEEWHKLEFLGHNVWDEDSQEMIEL